jgi:hypothetical protein
MRMKKIAFIKKQIIIINRIMILKRIKRGRMRPLRERRRLKRS